MSLSCQESINSSQSKSPITHPSRPSSILETQAICGTAQSGSSPNLRRGIYYSTTNTRSIWNSPSMESASRLCRLEKVFITWSSVLPTWRFRGKPTWKIAISPMNNMQSSSTSNVAGPSLAIIASLAVSILPQGKWHTRSKEGGVTQSH